MLLGCKYSENWNPKNNLCVKNKCFNIILRKILISVISYSGFNTHTTTFF